MANSPSSSMDSYDSYVNYNYESESHFHEPEAYDGSISILHQLLDNSKFEELQNTSINLAIHEIENHSLTLNIPKNPYLWSMAEASRWLIHMFDIPEWELVTYDKLDGIKLCSLSNEECQNIFGEKGDLVHSELDIWKEVSSGLLPRTDKGGQLNLCNIDLPTGSVRANYVPSEGYETAKCHVTSNEDISDSDDSGFEGNGYFEYQQYQQQFYPSHSYQEIGTIGNSDSHGKDEIDQLLQNRDIMDHKSSLNANSKLNLSCGDRDQFISELLGLPPNFFQSVPKEKRKYGKVGREKYKTRPQSSHLWYFIKQLLDQPELYGAYLRWLDRDKAVFRIYNSYEVARLWGKRKNRPAMNYDKLSRSLRQYYKKGIMMKTKRSQRLVYQFCGKYAT